MEKQSIAAPDNAPLDRIYIIAATLNAFKGRRHVEVHIFRHGATDEELAALEGKKLVGPPDPAVPPQVLQGATEKAALRCVLEAFTAEESQALVAYLEQRYAEHIEKIMVCPMDLPVPLGVAPLSGIPEGKSTGFIRFDAVPDYPLPFVARGFYDLAVHEPLMAE
ncbi:hypothetical protein FYJ44_00160 [Desulfovibrio sp. PG-178-WT-4]|uniref:Uncharacterized protein n=1 Tax=Desulfovibrio porci TaxID=2605782 RepID=A0A6L5XH36_9BACT|nr:hypothetical protein [Desulfovibrio porci]MDY3810584.1 hypothetical protein [Desulfovibrio porci]MSS26488.1 hypothetical protein [Desulfovibrio porci]